KYYIMGLWSANSDTPPRQSVPHQNDADADVATDILILNQPCARLQIRLTLGGGSTNKSKLKFLGLSLKDTRAEPEVLVPNKDAWGKCVPVPERSQMSYPNGGVLCSPTTVSMLLSYWSEKL